MEQKAYLPFSGVITALVTPFFSGKELDKKSFHHLLDLQKKAGVAGVVISGTTGESPTLSEDECQQLVLWALEHKAPDFHIYVGTGTNNTVRSGEMSLKYKNLVHPDTGARVDGVMAVVPYYNKPSQDGLLQHFSHIARTISPFPLCVYNVPGRTGTALQPATFLKLTQQCHNVVAIKEASGDVTILTEFVALSSQSPHPVCVLSGDDPTFAPSLLCGAQGLMSVTANVFPQQMQSMWLCGQEKQWLQLQKLHHQMAPISKLLVTLSANPVPVKAALALQGLCDGSLRLPLVELDQEAQKSLKSALKHMAFDSQEASKFS